jgi:hypothetical protein
MINSLVIYYRLNMSSPKKIGAVYNSLISNVTKRSKKQQRCMKRSTNNPDYIYMLGNKCIKPIVKSKRNMKHHNVPNKRLKHRYKQKTRRVKYNQKGGGVYGNATNALNAIRAGLLEIHRPPNVFPWEGQFARDYLNIY